MKIISEKQFVSTATASVKLFYPRSIMVPGQKIAGFKTNKSLISGLTSCEQVIISMYWKPIGDSLLFLSVVQACYDYLKIIRPRRMPKFILDDKFASLVKHIRFLKGAKIVKCGVDVFRGEIANGRKVVLITDDDPFKRNKDVPVFNSEEYLYPKFYDDSLGKIVEFTSRPARYYLTFERQVGKILYSNPEESLPDIIMHKDNILRNKCLTKYKFDPDDINISYIGIVGQASMVEKKFGLTRFLNVVKKLNINQTKTKVLFLANSKEESPGDWLKMKKTAEKMPCEIIFIDATDFELLAYIFARCHLVIGNDTGFSHLAAMCRKSNTSPRVSCIIIYSRHDWGKWRTGKDNVYPIVSELSEYLRKYNTSISRDKINLNQWGLKEWAYSVSEKNVVKLAKKLWKN